MPMHSSTEISDQNPTYSTGLDDITLSTCESHTICKDGSLAIQVLLISNNRDLRKAITSIVISPSWVVHEATSGADALETLHLHSTTQIVLLDPVLPDLVPDELRRLVHQDFPGIEILMLDGDNGNVVADGQSRSAYSTALIHLMDTGEKLKQLAPELMPLRPLQSVARAPRLRGMVGDSAAMQRVCSLTHMVAARETTVLITGESGTGKDLVAQAIHQVSSRRQSPFIVINCAAIPEALLESELFGYAKGAFTGALQSRIGRIHAAQGGTLFLDEIGDMPLSLQSKMLRFIEQGEVQRLGSNENMRVDVRIVAATNLDLASLVKQKLFREDLFYRINIFPIHLAPLRDRAEDLVQLAEFFASKFSPGVALSASAMDILKQHKWPGNIRELRNVIERASIIAGAATEISGYHILF